MALSWERIQEIPPQWRWKNPLYLLSLISYHITLQRSELSSLPLKSTAVLDTFMAGPVCVDAMRIVSDRLRAQIAVSKDVELLPHVAVGVSSLCGRGWVLLTEDGAHWLKTLQLWAKCHQEYGEKLDQQLPPAGLASADEHGGPGMAFSQAVAEINAPAGGANGHWQRRSILPLTSSLCLLQSEIGFGKLETYIKLDKLGEVRPYLLSYSLLSL